VNLEQLGLLGIFIAGAIPWFEAIAVVPAGIVFGLNPVFTVIAAVMGNAITIFLFAFAASRIRGWFVQRREAKGKPGESPKFQKALAAFDKYGIYGLALLGPVLIGTQFAAAASVVAGVKPLKVSLLITVSMAIWSIAIAAVIASLGVNII
jgi:hypothetical protein